MRLQTADTILMVRPANFGFNEETAANNAFQTQSNVLTPAEIKKRAIDEFDEFVQKLREVGVNVLVARDTTRPVRPDAVFPNNWVTFHQEGIVITYPMFAPTRRRERRRAIIDLVCKHNFTATKRIRLEYNEKLNRFLEGTGSIIFDHPNRLAYACLSPRTDAGLLDELCRQIGYEPIAFRATDAEGRDIYHTNVMMALGETFVVICMDSIPDEESRQRLRALFEKTGKTIVSITHEQMNCFAGNMLQVRNAKGERILVMSTQACNSLDKSQIALLRSHTLLLHAPLFTIEKYGGGSARCMMAEVFLPKAAGGDGS